jgi:guanylate kinase
MPDKMAFSVSATTRKPRPGEENGREYHFLESEDFEKRVENNEFLEHEEVYAGVLYGTLWSEVHKIWDAGKAVVFDVDVQGGLNLKRRFKQDALAIFLRPPSVEILMQRLRKRSTEVEHHLQERIAKANHELSFENQYDVVVVNDVLEDTLKTCEQLVTEFLNTP